MNTTPTPRPLVLMILDGYGISFIEEGNAIMAAKKPNIDSLMQNYPLATLNAGSQDVGLPWGEVGNSETGHQNIGSGRVTYQFLPRIFKSIEDGSFFLNEELLQTIQNVQDNPTSALHIMGLLSNGGIHSHINHQLALLKSAQSAGIGDRTYIHVFLDGRDSSPDDAKNFLQMLENEIKKTGAGVIQTMVGRYYAMDRAENIDRTETAFTMMTQGAGQHVLSWQEGLEIIAKEKKRDSVETAGPIIVDGEKPFRPIQDGDSVICYNYRSDRARQITRMFVEKTKTTIATMASYDKTLPVHVLFSDEEMKNTLGEIVSQHGMKQLRISEGEKHAHVTYFFNGAREEPYEGETDITIPSLTVKDFSTRPEMSAREITQRTIEELHNNIYDVIVINYANPDMVGHTGQFEPAIEAIEVIDEQIGLITQAVLAQGGGVLITCDHGNAEIIINHLTHEQSTDHTNNPVPLMYISPYNKLPKSRDMTEVQQILATPIGFLADVAPTALEILGIEKPDEMTGVSLLSSLR